MPPKRGTTKTGISANMSTTTSTVTSTVDKKVVVPKKEIIEEVDSDQDEQDEQDDQHEQHEQQTFGAPVSTKLKQKVTTRKWTDGDDEPDQSQTQEQEDEQEQEQEENFEEMHMPPTQTQTFGYKQVQGQRQRNVSSPQSLHETANDIDNTSNYPELYKLDAENFSKFETIDIIRVLESRGYRTHNPALWTGAKKLRKQLCCEKIERPPFQKQNIVKPRDRGTKYDHSSKFERPTYGSEQHTNSKVYPTENTRNYREPRDQENQDLPRRKFHQEDQQTYQHNHQNQSTRRFQQDQQMQPPSHKISQSVRRFNQDQQSVPSVPPVQTVRRFQQELPVDQESQFESVQYVQKPQRTRHYD
jgi:hypothetical protein